MVRDAVAIHDAFDTCNLSVYAKGSYANNTNVKADSDVDIVVQCHNVVYWEEHVDGQGHPAGGAPYSGEWTPSRLRSELVSALTAKFGSQVDTSGTTAIQVNSSSSRVDADVVPSFDFKYYFPDGSYREGTRIFKNDGWSSIENYPAQHLAKGRAKNSATNNNFKKLVRILKRVENAMVAASVHREVPSYFVECLVYNCPNDIFRRSTWVSAVKGALGHIWEGLEGNEPSDDSDRWVEVNECKYLFHSAQKWSRQDGRDFAYAAWNYLSLADA
jgi:hypothetical protein